MKNYVTIGKNMTHCQQMLQAMCLSPINVLPMLSNLITNVKNLRNYMYKQLGCKTKHGWSLGKIKQFIYLKTSVKNKNTKSKNLCCK